MLTAALVALGFCFHFHDISNDIYSVWLSLFVIVYFLKPMGNTTIDRLRYATKSLALFVFPTLLLIVSE